MKLAMMMAAVSTNTLLLCCCFIITSTVSQDSCTYATVDEDITLPLDYTVTNLHTLKWYHGKKLILHRKSGKFVLGKSDDIDDKGSLKLRDVNKTDDVLYKAEVHKDGMELHGKTFKLCVSDKIQKPTVKVTCPKSPSSASTVTFTCEFPKDQGLSVQWLENKNVLESNNSTLTVHVDQLKKHSYTCKVYNPSNFETSQPVSPECHVKGAIPEKLFGFPFWTMVGMLAGGGGLVLLLIVITIVCYSRSKRKRQKHLEEEGELRLEWTNQHKQQQHQQQHQQQQQQQQQPAGRTSPRQHRPKPARDPERPRGPETSGTNPRRPRPSPRTPGQGPRPVGESEEEHPPPLPQPRKKASKTARAKQDVNAGK